METDLIALSAAVLAASALQSATGIGFGIIAGPVLLVVLNDSSGIQISVMLNLLIALLLARSLFAFADHRVLKGLIVGVLLGSPLGLLIYLSLDLALLKLLAAIAVAFSLIVLLRGDRRTTFPEAHGSGRTQPVMAGLMGGIMGGSLAMPGPVPAAWMAAQRHNKDVVRATILLMFVAAYAVVLLLQFVFAGITAETFSRSVSLAPATIGGVLLGHALSKRIAEDTFRRILIAVLSLTIALLLLTIRA